MKMKWTGKDIERYMQEKDYIDTALVPLVPVSWQTEVQRAVEIGEFTVILADELEKQLKGRIFHFPPFTYLTSEDTESCINRLCHWKDEMKAEMPYLFFITADVTWKNIEDRLPGSLIWVPSVPLAHMTSDYRHDMISSQMKQVLEIVTNQWRNSYNRE